MIYQCYFRPEQAARLFDSPLYVPFGLEPAVNPDLTRNCPELGSERVRRQLSEYGAMLHLWRNRSYVGRWIGFTSYRQLDKRPTVLTNEPRLLRQLERHEILGWGFFDCPRGPALASERWHPGIVSFMAEQLAAFAEVIPESFASSCRRGLFANYWIMGDGHFESFMEWCHPKIDWALARMDSHDFLRSNPRALGFVMERLFIVWYLMHGMKPLDIELQDVSLRRAFACPRYRRKLIRRSVKKTLLNLRRNALPFLPVDE